MATTGPIRVEGLTELIAAFRKADAGLGAEIRKTLIDTADVVKDDAEAKARGRIRNIGPRWSRMRLGMTAGVVYIAPAQRRSVGTPRPNLAVLLLEQAMIPAASENEERVRRNFEDAIDDLNANAGLIRNLHALI